MNSLRLLRSDNSGQSIDRRNFLLETGLVALATGAAGSVPQLAAAAGESVIAGDGKSSRSPESIVKLLYESFTPGQRETVCFGWDHDDEDRGLLRSRVSANWMITPPTLNSDFYTAEQVEMVRAIFEGIVHPDWHQRYYQQQEDDSDGFGERNGVAIFGRPDSGKFEFVLTGRHMTLRCDGNSAEHVAFGGPIFYGHAANDFNEEPNHPGNIFWPQAVEANRLYEALDGRQQQLLPARTARTIGLPQDASGLCSIGRRCPITEYDRLNKHDCENKPHQR